MNHASLFSGIGACELAAEWMGWGNIFHCEINPFGQQVLNYYWPESKAHHDIKTTDFTPYRGTVDVLSGGFPCQPFSTAGKRKGTEDNRNLWPEMLRAVREISPRWVVAENVRGFTNWNGGLVFDQVQADLENEGYECLPFLLPACAVGAPHRRDRIWIIAYSSSIDGRMLCGYEGSKGRIQKKFTINTNISGDGFTPNPTFQPSKRDGFKERKISKSKQGEFRGSDSEDAIADTERIRQPRQGRPKGQSHTEAFRNWQASWADANGGWPTQPPVRWGNDGLSTGLAGITIPKHRKESLMAYGNSMVPQVVHQIFKAIMKIESHSS